MHATRFGSSDAERATAREAWSQPRFEFCNVRYAPNALFFIRRAHFFNWFAIKASAIMSRMDRPSLTAGSALALAMLVALALASCQTVQTTQPGAVGVERQQSMLLSASQVDKSAAQAYQQEMKKAAGKNALNRDAAQVARVKAVAQRLIPATAAFRPDAPRWAWEVNVITSGDVNAWCMPGGKMAVYTGLIDKLKITDDELAAVMGHEIGRAHV